jgi:hypothetical protein
MICPRRSHIIYSIKVVLAVRDDRVLAAAEVFLPDLPLPSTDSLLEPRLSNEFGGVNKVIAVGLFWT